MSQGDKWDAKKVQPIAEQFVAEIDAGCELIEIAGSLRRGKQLVGDIEVVLIEKHKTAPSSMLFGPPEAHSELRPLLDKLVTAGRLITELDGPKHKKYRVARLRRPLFIDLFSVQPAGWGNQLAIRTGPSWLSKRMVTQRAKGGLLNDSYVCRDGLVWQSAPTIPAPADGSRPPSPYTLIDGNVFKMHPCPTEADFMQLLSCGFVEPGKRAHL